jgi:2-polyprenyl-3-methyl-5-hydroxy-6-metoxy-1,4-benzoquinol methylase
MALRIVMRLHGLLYDLCGILAVGINGGIHPKHRILRYKEWFLDRIEPTDVVLDVGSNTGALPILIAGKALHVYGIEIDPTLARIAQERCQRTNIEILTGDATAYDYKFCQPITCVTLSNVLEHIESRVIFIKRLLTTIRWNGSSHRKFLVRVPTIERDWLSVYKQEFGVEYRLDRTHAIEHTRQKLLEELTEAGLRIESFETHFGEFYAVCYG